VVAAAGVLIVLSAAGLPLGWFDSQDMEPLGGLIITVIFLELPFLSCLLLGVWSRQSRALRRQSNGITRLERLG
jgi:ABC-type Fe3+ transport system permease subunit